MATVTQSPSQALVLRRVPYKLYERLTKVAANRHLRMTYHDGTLEIVSPRLQKHETPSARLRLIVTHVADRLGLIYHATDSFTFRKQGRGPYQGQGKEPDKSFYFASTGRLPRDRDPDLDAGDPPPDLWIEVDNRVSSAGRLPIYSSLGVPEVWRYQSKTNTIQFLKLNEQGYERIERSLSLPCLTPGLVEEALAMGNQLFESEWLALLRDWVVRTIPVPVGGP